MRKAACVAVAVVISGMIWFDRPSAEVLAQEAEGLKTKRPAAIERKPAPSVERLPKRSTRLYIRTSPPGAKITLNGESYGASDQLITVPAGAKRMTLVIELDGYQTDEKLVIVQGGRIKRIEVDLEKLPETARNDPAEATGPKETPAPSDTQRPPATAATAKDKIVLVKGPLPLPMTPLEKTLLKKTTLALGAMPLGDAAKVIDQRLPGVNVLIDHKALEDIGETQDVPVSLSVSDVSMRAALNIMLRERDLTWMIRRGVLLITTREEAESRLTTKIYPAGDLTNNCDGLIEIITCIVRPTSWDEVGGSGSIYPDSANAGLALVVSQTDAVHFEVADLLSKLREVVAGKGSDANRAGRAVFVEEAIEAALDRRVSVEFDEMPLSDVVDYLRKTLNEPSAAPAGEVSAADTSDANRPAVLMFTDSGDLAPLEFAREAMEAKIEALKSPLDMIPEDSQTAKALNERLEELQEEYKNDGEFRRLRLQVQANSRRRDEVKARSVKGDKDPMYLRLTEQIERDTKAFQQIQAEQMRAIDAMIERILTRKSAEERKELLTKLKQLRVVERSLQGPGESQVVDVGHVSGKVNVLIDRKALGDIGLDDTVPISIKLSDVSLRTALDLALPQVGLTWMIRDEVLWISTPEEASCELITKIYDVDDLSCERPDLPEIITGMVRPDTWDEIGGPGSIGEAAIGGVDVLIVSQTDDVHHGISKLLRNLRRIAAEAAEGKLPGPIVDNYGVRGAPHQGPLHEALNRRISVDYREMPLRDVAEHLRKTAGINVMIDRKALDNAGLNEDTPVTTEIDAKLQTVLRLALRELDLTWTAQDDVLVVTTPEEANLRLVTGIYPVTDLVVRRDGLGRLVHDSLFVMEIITCSLVPDCWDTVGGPGSIGELALNGVNVLVVGQTLDVHEDVGQLLATLRNIARQTAAGKLPERVLLEGREREANERIRNVLQQKTAVEFDKLPLRDVARWAKAKYGIEAQLDTRALEDVGLDADTEVSISLKEIDFASALELMLEQIDLTYMVRDGVLLITTPEEAALNLMTGFYPVGDMIAQRDYDALMEMIRTTIKPESWNEIGGPGSIAAASSEAMEVLVVSQTAGVHREVTALLADLRKRQPTSTGPRGPRVHPGADGKLESRVLKEAMIHLLAEAMVQRQPPARRRSKAEMVQWLVQVLPWERPRLFPASSEQERRFVAGKFADARTAGHLEQRIKQLEQSEKELPWLAQYLIERFRAGKLSGARLEAASRMLGWPNLNAIGPLHLGNDGFGGMGTGGFGGMGMGMGGMGGMGGIGMGGFF